MVVDVEPTDLDVVRRQLVGVVGDHLVAASSASGRDPTVGPARPTAPRSRCTAGSSNATCSSASSSSARARARRAPPTCRRRCGCHPRRGPRAAAGTNRRPRWPRSTRRARGSRSSGRRRRRSSPPAAPIAAAPIACRWVGSGGGSLANTRSAHPPGWRARGRAAGGGWSRTTGFISRTAATSTPGNRACRASVIQAGLSPGRCPTAVVMAWSPDRQWPVTLDSARAGRVASVTGRGC